MATKDGTFQALRKNVGSLSQNPIKQAPPLAGKSMKWKREVGQEPQLLLLIE